MGQHQKGAKHIAILKHYSVHNSNYHDAVLYLTYQHDNHASPVYDEHGLMIERENLLIGGINTDAFSYGYDCVEQFQRILQEEHGITVKESRGRWSYLPEGRERPITWRKLGEVYKKEAIEAVIAGNLQRENERQAQSKQPQPEQELVLGPLPTEEEMRSTSPQIDEPVHQSQQAPTPQAHHAPDADEDFFLYGRIIDLNSPQVQESYSLLQWSKIQNLKENARRFAFMTESGLLNVDRLAAELSRTRKAFYQKQSQQVAVEKRLKEVNGILRDVAAFYETNKAYNQYTLFGSGDFSHSRVG